MKNGSSFKKAADAQQAQLQEYFFSLIESGDATAAADFLRDHSGAHAWRRTIEDADGNNYEEMPLHNAASFGRLDVVKELVMAGADVNGENSRGLTALMFAAGGNKPDIVAFLVAEGADVNALSHDGASPLGFAAVNGALECARILMDGGADVAATSTGGETPLFSAVRMEFESSAKDMVRLLLESGADPAARNSNGETAEDVAFEMDRQELSAYIGACAREIAAERKEEARAAALRDIDMLKEGAPAPIRVQKPLKLKNPAR
jgi:hypothetical protein